MPLSPSAVWVLKTVARRKGRDLVFGGGAISRTDEENWTMNPSIYAYRRGSESYRKPRAEPELALQIAVKQFLVLTVPADIEWTASLAGAHLGPSQRAKMKAAGLRGGWPDIQFCIHRRMHFIELKAPTDVVSRMPERYGTLDDPDLSPAQRRVLSRLHPECWAICRSVEQVRDALMRWGVELRAHTLIRA